MNINNGKTGNVNIPGPLHSTGGDGDGQVGGVVAYAGDVYDETLGKNLKEINAEDLKKDSIVASALNDLNEKIKNAIPEKEFSIISTALNNLNNRLKSIKDSNNKIEFIGKEGTLQRTNITAQLRNLNLSELNEFMDSYIHVLKQYGGDLFTPTVEALYRYEIKTVIEQGDFIPKVFESNLLDLSNSMLDYSETKLYTEENGEDLNVEVDQIIPSTLYSKIFIVLSDESLNSIYIENLPYYSDNSEVSILELEKRTGDLYIKGIRNSVQKTLKDLKIDSVVSVSLNDLNTKVNNSEKEISEIKPLSKLGKFVLTPIKDEDVNDINIYKLTIRPYHYDQLARDLVANTEGIDSESRREFLTRNNDILENPSNYFIINVNDLEDDYIKYQFEEFGVKAVKIKSDSVALYIGGYPDYFDVLDSFIIKNNDNGEYYNIVKLDGSYILDYYNSEYPVEVYYPEDDLKYYKYVFIFDDLYVSKFNKSIPEVINEEASINSLALNDLNNKVKFNFKQLPLEISKEFSYDYIELETYNNANYYRVFKQAHYDKLIDLDIWEDFNLNKSNYFFYSLQIDFNDGDNYTASKLLTNDGISAIKIGLREIFGNDYHNPIGDVTKSFMIYDFKNHYYINVVKIEGSDVSSYVYNNKLTVNINSNLDFYLKGIELNELAFKLQRQIELSKKKAENTYAPFGIASLALNPNVFYYFDKVDSMTISNFNLGEEGYLLEYEVQFEANTASTTLTFPSGITIKWKDGDDPSSNIQANKIYKIKITGINSNSELTNILGSYEVY